MKSMLSAFALSAILLVSVGMAPAALGQQASITVMTDRESYSGTDTITISGNVAVSLPTQISMWVTAPNDNRVAVGQISVAPDMTFGTTMSAGGPLWQESGTYTLTVQYGESSRQASTTFEYSQSDAMMVDPDPHDVMMGDAKTVPLTPTDNPSEEFVSVEITGGTVDAVSPMPQNNSLLVSITADDDGSLTITIPRSVADAVSDDGNDDQYYVLVDNEEREFAESVTDDARTLTIEFEAGAEQIEIIGTWVIPEFGTIAAMILAAAIVSVIAVSARSRLSIIPRY